MLSIRSLTKLLTFVRKFNKVLWTGSWSSGNITVPDIENYSVVIIDGMIGVVHDDFVQCIGGYGTTYQYVQTFHAPRSGNVLTYENSLVVQHKTASPYHTNTTTSTTISSITGLIPKL